MPEKAERSGAYAPPLYELSLRPFRLGIQSSGDISRNRTAKASEPIVERLP